MPGPVLVLRKIDIKLLVIVTARSGFASPSRSSVAIFVEGKSVLKSILEARFIMAPPKLFSCYYVIIFCFCSLTINYSNWFTPTVSEAKEMSVDLIFTIR